MSRIYLASSWKNSYHSLMINWLRTRGHEAYDFTARGYSLTPGTQECRGFDWKDIGAPEDLSFWTFSNFRHALTSNPQAAAGYLSDLRYMEWADTCLLLLPCGRSAHLEAGYMKGRGKRLIIVQPEAERNFEPELMYLLADQICNDQYELEAIL
jgi:hypothetical protein